MAERRVMDEPAAGGLKAAVNRKASLLHTLRAVAWSFFGVRRGAAHAQDVQKLNPLHLAIAGVLSAAAFVVALVVLVKWVIGSGVAA